MGVPVVIDGYNLLYARGEAPSAGSRERLVRDLLRWAQARGRRAVVVFDAWAQGERVEQEVTRGPVTIFFTRYGERADERIVRWVAAHPEAVVVTSDRGVRRAVGRRGAAVLDSGAFADRLEAVTDSPAETGDPPRGESPRPQDPSGRSRSPHAAWLRDL